MRKQDTPKAIALTSTLQAEGTWMRKPAKREVSKKQKT